MRSIRYHNASGGKTNLIVRERQSPNTHRDHIVIELATAHSWGAIQLAPNQIGTLIEQLTSKLDETGSSDGKWEVLS